MSFFVILLTLMVVLDALWLLQTWKLARPLARRWLVRTIAGGFFALQIAGLLAVVFDRVTGPHFAWLLSRPVLSAVFIWHLLLLPLLSLGWLAWRIGMLPVQLGRWLIGRREPAREPSTPDLSRREFLAVSLAAAPAVFTIAATAVAQPQLEQFRVRRATLPLPQLPPALDGLTIAQVSDLHVGRFTRGRLLREIVEATNALRADLVLLTGDLINYDLADLPAALDLVKAMRGEHGVFMCEGNHDLIENPETFEAGTRAAGVALLVNETAPLEINGTAVQLLGLPWSHGDADTSAAMRSLLVQRNAGAFPILLAHHPHAFDFAENLPLTLAGHTHGGQLMINERIGAGPALFRYWSGLYRRGDRALFVSNGVGNWFPLRVRAPAEIVHLTLRRG